MNFHPRVDPLLIEQANVIQVQAHKIRQMDKTIGNLADQIKFQAEDQRLAVLKDKALMRFSFDRNKNWRQSAWIGFREAVLFAPTYFFRAAKLPFIALLGTIGLSATAIWTFAFGIVGVLALGLLGRLSPKEETS